MYCNLIKFKSCHVRLQVEDTAAEDVPDKLDVDDVAEHPDSTDQSSVLDDPLPLENALSESVTLLQEVENILQKEEVPKAQAFTQEVLFEEEMQLHEGSIENEVYEVEEDNRKEEAAADHEKMDCAGEEVVMEREDIEDTNMEEIMDEEEKQESEEDAEKEADQVKEMLGEEDKDEEQKEEEVNETKDHSCQLEDEDQTIKLDTSIKTESFYEISESDDSSATVSTEVEDLLAQKCTEQPSFVVMTSLKLSFPDKTVNLEPEDVTVILPEDADIMEECQDQFTECLQIDDEHSEEVHHKEVLSESHQSGISESELIQEISHSAADDEPVFHRSPSRDQCFEAMRAEPSACQVEVETQSLPSFPLQREICQADEDTAPENPFGVRLRKTPVLHRYASEGESLTPNTEPVETQKSPFLEQLSRKPAVSKKPDQADGAVKPRRISGTNCLFCINYPY